MDLCVRGVDADIENQLQAPRLGLTTADLDVIELNEAFAAQGIAGPAIVANLRSSFS